VALDDELAAGRLDGVIALTPPPCFRRGDPHIRRLFPDWRRRDTAYYERFAVFPIMHVVGIRKDVLRADPDLGRKICDAFDCAKRCALEDLAGTQANKVTLPWPSAALEEARALMGEDFWPYGIAANQAALSAALRHLQEDGLLAQPLSVDELFSVSSDRSSARSIAY
jgi:4,5-dihydroxyphthalate decarboxylase